MKSSTAMKGRFSTLLQEKEKKKLNGGSRSQGKSSISLEGKEEKNELPVEAGLLEKGSKQRKSFFKKRRRKYRSE